MKKYNFLKDPSEPPEPETETGSPGSLSPQARRLMILGIVGVVLSGALYVYMTYFTQPPPPPSPVVLRERAAPPAPPPQVRVPPPVREPVKPPVVVTPKPPPEVERKAPEGAATVTPPAPQERLPLAPKSPEKALERPAPPPAPAEAEKPAPPPAPKVAKAPDTGERRYTLQVASLVLEQNAQALKKRLEKLGYTPTIRMVTAPITRHRVQMGEFGSRQEAEETARRLNVDGFPSNVVQGEGGRFHLEVGSSFHLNDAIDLAHNLQKKNYTAKIVSQSAATPVHQVSVGEYASQNEAREALDALKKQGFAPLIVRR